MRARRCPSRACIWMSSAKFDASQPIPRPKGVAPASSEPSEAGKLAAVVGVAAPAVSPETGPPGGAPRTSRMGPLVGARRPQATPDHAERPRVRPRHLHEPRFDQDRLSRPVDLVDELPDPRDVLGQVAHDQRVRSLVNGDRTPRREQADPLALLALRSAHDHVLDAPLIRLGNRIGEKVDVLDLLDSNVGVLEPDHVLGQRLEFPPLASYSSRLLSLSRSWSFNWISASFRRAWRSISRCSCLKAASASLARFSSVSTRMMLPSCT